jgi:hypothetical protein
MFSSSALCRPLRNKVSVLGFLANNLSCFVVDQGPSLNAEAYYYQMRLRRIWYTDAEVSS